MENQSLSDFVADNIVLMSRVFELTQDNVAAVYEWATFWGALTVTQLVFWSSAAPEGNIYP